MEVIVDIGIKVAALITRKSAEKYNLSKRSLVWIGIKATAVQFIEKE
jgi:molybdopterin-binding protein